MKSEFDLQNIHIHSIHVDYNKFDCNKSLEKLKLILSSKCILARRKMGDVDENKNGFNGIDYISLCDYSLRDKTYQDFADYNGYSGYR